MKLKFLDWSCLAGWEFCTVSEDVAEASRRGVQFHTRLEVAAASTEDRSIRKSIKFSGRRHLELDTGFNPVPLAFLSVDCPLRRYRRVDTLGLMPRLIKLRMHTFWS